MGLVKLFPVCVNEIPLLRRGGRLRVFAERQRFITAARLGYRWRSRETRMNPSIQLVFLTRCSLPATRSGTP